MAVTLTHVGRTPRQGQFDLDQFTEHYKCDAAADVVLTDSSVPQKGDAHPSYSKMFVTDRYCSETGTSASALDLVYMGCLKTSGGNPVLPPIRHKEGSTIRSATSSTSSAIWPRVASSPCSAEYFAPTSETYEFAASDTSSTVCPDPAAITSLLTFNIVPGGTVPALGLPTLAEWILTNAFTQEVVETDTANEIVAGQFWQITRSKVTTLFPWAPISGGGAGIFVNNPGTGYAVSDSLSISAGGQSASILVVAVDASTGAIALYTVSSNSFTAPHSGLSASGGSGSGATFDVILS